MKRIVLILFLWFVTASILAQDNFSQAAKLRAEAETDEKKGAEFESSNDFNQASAHYSKAANYYWANGINDRAISLYSKALEMSNRLGNLNAQYVLNTNIGTIYTDGNAFESALKHFEMATRIAQSLNRKVDRASSLVNQANALFELNRHSQVIDVLNQAHTIAQELNDPKLLRNVYSVYTKAYDKMGNREESAKYFGMFSAISKKIQDEEIRKREEDANRKVTDAEGRIIVAESGKKFVEKKLEAADQELRNKQLELNLAQSEAEKREFEIAKLNAERDFQKAEIQRQRLLTWVYISIIAVTLILTVLIYSLYVQKKKSNMLLKAKNSEISRKNVEISAQARELSELNHVKDKIFSIISHDLRSPISSLITMITLSEQGYLNEEGFKKIMPELSKNVGYTATLLDNLLKWAQSQLKGLVVTPTSFSLNEILSSRFAMLHEQAQSKAINLITDIKRDYSLYADIDMTELVIRNLISNAIKFCNPHDKITVTAVQRDGMVQVCVIDTGVGISEEAQKKMFGLQANSTRGTNNEKGTGLGLVLCKDFVEINGGQIWVESSVGKGSKFCFTLPEASVEVQPKDIPVHQNANQG